MLERYEQNGLILYRSPLLHTIGVPHAFTTRYGGVSSPPFASLNLGTVGGSAIQDPNENLREIADILSIFASLNAFNANVGGKSEITPDNSPNSGTSGKSKSEETEQ